MNYRTLWLCLAGMAAFALAGCEKQGPLERAGEEIDEAVDTAKNGRESTANKVDDALDEVREGAAEAKGELEKKD